MADDRLMAADKEQRLRTAKYLLRQIRQNGGAAKDLAKFLRLSQTTISHWQSSDERRLRRVAAPTDMHLKRLAGFYCFLLQQNIEQFLDLTCQHTLRDTERLLILTALQSQFAESADRLRSQFRAAWERSAKIAAKLNELLELGEVAGMSAEKLRVVYDLSGLPGADELERGEFDPRRICPPQDWVERFAESMMNDVEGFMMDQDESLVNEEELNDQEVEP